MKDDPEFNIHFVHLVEENPCLYDHNNPYYTNRDVQDMTWEKIAREVTETAHDCKERWKNLRACYTRYLKSLSCVPGTPGSTKFRKPYYLTDYLSFLKPFTKTRKPRGSFMQNVQLSPLFQKVNHCEENSEEENEEVIANDLETTTNQQSLNDSTDNEQSLVFAPYAKKIKTESEPYFSGEEANRPNCDMYQQRQNYLEYRSEAEDADFLFLKSILPDMREMNSLQKRKFKIGILNLAVEILNGADGSAVPSTHPSSSTSLAAMPAIHNEHDSATI